MGECCLKGREKRKDYAGHCFHCRHRVHLFCRDSVRSRVRKAGRDEAMSFENAALLIICGLLLGYLIYALLKAEEF